MSDINTLKSAIYDEITSVVSQYVADADVHVIREDDDEPDQPPMVALNGQEQSRNSKGMHKLHVFDVFSNPFDVKYGRERTFAVDVTTADVDGSREGDILEGIQNAFTYDSRFRDPSTFIDSIPIDEIRIEDTSPTNRDMRVGNSLAIEVDYTQTFLYSEVNNPPSQVTKVAQSYDNYPITITTDGNGFTVEE